MTELSGLPPSTRRTLAARLPGPLGRLAASLGRAVERGDPRLGLVVGLPVAVLVAWAFTWRVRVAAGFEDKVLDRAFLWRAPIPESDRVLMVDQNDETYKMIQVDRKAYAGVLLALHRLGVRRTVFDVEFKMTVPRPDQYDLETGQYRLKPEEGFLRDTIAVARHVTLAFHFDMTPLEEDVRRALPRMKEALARKFISTPEDLAAASGLPLDQVRSEFENLFQMATQALVRDRLARSPSLSFADLRTELLPGEAALREKDRAKILQFSYWAERGIGQMAGRLLPVRIEGDPAGLRHPDSMILPLGPFLEGADSIAAANADADPDGVLRRPWTAMIFRGRPCLYLGLEGALRAMARDDESVEPVLKVHEFQIQVKGRSDGSLRRTVTLPIDEEGRVLVDWAGNPERRRGGKATYFAHLPFHELLAFYEERYELMDRHFRTFLEKASEDEGKPVHPEYAALSTRLGEFLAGRGTVPPAEVDGLEDRLDALRRRVLSDLEGDLAILEKAIPGLPSPRARESSAKDLDRRRQQLSGLRKAYDREADLRPRVEGKIAWIGSASTAGGDLHALPLGIAVPGVDVPASVTNMVLTAQALRQVPRGVDFAYLLGIGMFVSWAVTHWGTMTV
ncbi:MAG TPA: CHASE2 domain-containing protein, partial [Planctomycetota bacterium]|nr:CHASE2 domain-containing protein [Planctomycetota bacterium]